MNDKQEDKSYCYNTIDIENSVNSYTLIFNNNSKKTVGSIVNGKHQIDMIRNTIMRAYLTAKTLAKNSDPVMFKNHCEMNGLISGTKNKYDICITVDPNWGKILYSILFTHFVEDDNTKQRSEFVYENNNLTEKDLLCFLHHLLPKVSKHVHRKKNLSEHVNYLASISQVK